jgi:asparagine synthetase B (glutamine-hydrolysing)
MLYQDEFTVLVGAEAAQAFSQYRSILPSRTLCVDPLQLAPFPYVDACHFDLDTPGDWRIAEIRSAGTQAPDSPLTITFALSPFHTKSIFYGKLSTSEAEVWVFSTDFAVVKALLFSTRSPTANSLALAQWVLGRPDPHLSMYQDIHQLAPAHTLTVTIAPDFPQIDMQSRRFWDIEPERQIIHDDPRDYQVQLRELIISAINVRLPDSEGVTSSTRIATQMSGGMDSTTISALLHGQLHNPDQQLHQHVISHRYANTAACDETKNIIAMQNHFGFAHFHTLDMGRFANMPFAELYPTDAQNPGIVRSPKYATEAQFCQSHNITQVFTGNGGDEMFWGHSQIYLDRLRAGEWEVLPESIKAARALNISQFSMLKDTFIKPWLKYVLPNKQLFDVLQYQPPWLGETAKALLAAQPHPHNPFIGDSLSKQFRYHGLFYTATYNSMRAYQAVARDLGIRITHPLMDRDIAEFSFAIPQKHWLQQQYPKYLLRQSMQDILPKQVCWDQHKTTFDDHFKRVVATSAPWIRRLLSHPDLHEQGIINNDVIITAFDAMLADSNAALNVDMLYAILVQSWYQTHCLAHAPSSDALNQTQMPLANLG